MNRFLLTFLALLGCVACEGKPPTADEIRAVWMVASGKDYRVLEVKHIRSNRVAVLRGILDQGIIFSLEECVFSVRPPEQVWSCVPLWPSEARDRAPQGQ